MAGDTFLTLTNRVLTHFNEVNLTSSNFASATGFQSAAKNYVNNAIRRIQQAEYEWPFNWYQRIDTLSTTNVLATYVSGTLSYPGLVLLGTYAESVDWESFTVVRDDAIPVSETKLKYMDYDEWVEKYRPQDIAQIGSTTLGNQIPKAVVRPQIDGYYLITPLPAVAAKVRYEYWGYPTELSLHGDTTSIPTRFNWVIDALAFEQGYIFRGNAPMASYYKNQGIGGISQMRELLINRYKKLRDGRIGNAG